MESLPASSPTYNPFLGTTINSPCFHLLTTACQLPEFGGETGLLFSSYPVSCEFHLRTFDKIDIVWNVACLKKKKNGTRIL